MIQNEGTCRRCRVPNVTLDYRGLCPICEEVVKNLYPNVKVITQEENKV